MDQKYVNIIYYNKESNKFALIFIILVLLLPNIGIIFGMALVYGDQLLKNSAILLPLGIYTILNTMLMIFSFFSMENNREKSIRVLDEGLVYNSLLKKFAIQWENVERIQFNPFLARRPIIMVHTTKGRFYFSGMFINVEQEIPEIKPGFIKPKFYYPSGGEFEGDIYTNELYLILKETIPEKFY